MKVNPNQNVNLTQALNARVEWAMSRISTLTDDQKFDHSENAEAAAYLGGYTSFPNPYIPALVRDVPVLANVWNIGWKDKEIGEAVTKEGL